MEAASSPSTAAAAEDASACVDEDIANAAVHDAFSKIVSAAAGRAVDAGTVSKVAGAHGDGDFSATLDRGARAAAALRGRAHAALAALEPLYTRNGMLAALRLSHTPPAAGPAAGTLAIGDNFYRTRRGTLLAHVWALLNPGHAVQSAFFAGMAQAQCDMADPDDFLAFFTATVTNSVLSDARDRLRSAWDATGEHCGAAGVRKRKRTRPGGD